MLLDRKNFSLYQIINFLFCLFPISFIIGSLIVNLNLYLFLILSIIYINKNNYKFNFDKIKILLTCFFLFIVLSSIINIYKFDLLLKSISLLRFLILFFVIEILLLNNKLNLKGLFTTSILCTSFVAIDVIIQYIFGEDIFGYKPWDGMIAGPFEHEAIAGSYIQKFSLFSIFSSLFLFKEKNRKQILFLITLLLLSSAFLTNNRMSTILFLFSIIILIFIDKKNRVIFFSSLAVFLIIAAFLINRDDSIKNRYENLYKRFQAQENIENEVKKTVEKKEEEKVFDKKVDPYESFHFRIYLTVIESWKNNPIMGWGHKSFRNVCKNITIEKASCSTHPHNYHLEVLHNTGLVGFFVISLFVFLILFEIIKKLKNEKFYNITYGVYFIPIAVAIIIEIWPIKSSGSLFTSWNGTAVWLIISLMAITKINFDKNYLIENEIKQKNTIVLFSIILLSSLIIKKIYLYYEFYQYF